MIEIAIYTEGYNSIIKNLYTRFEYYITLSACVNLKNETLPDECPNTTLLFQIAVDVAR
jgi:hypothetical protein